MSKKKTYKPRQPKINLKVGEQFEEYIVDYTNRYIESKGCNGIAYCYPFNSRYNQKIDVMIDGMDKNIYAGIECKSIFENSYELSTVKNKYLDRNNIRNIKIYFSKLFNVNRFGLSQLERQHGFLINSSRYGLIAFQFRCMKEVFIVPHQFIYDLYQHNSYVTLDQIIMNGYQLGSKGSLIIFIRNKCKVEVDR
jgi:hypothetical protein